ncbi:unnamed protein product, partial [Mesorhabditis belari]|uniref:DUF3752 domain-containing protein n=1 Tax=Mesorhabditis belari TaxID=2138241 RepID=A0AAF3FNT1_9BILA
MSREGAHDVLPLPNWDDGEELDYSEDFTDPVQNDDFVEEPCSSNNVTSPSLPRMEELEPEGSRNIGPSLPAGFVLDNRIHPDDPEDPGSQSRRMPGSDNDSLPSLPVIGPELPSRQIGPALPAALAPRDDAPSLPDAELRARSPVDFGVTNHIPPPEPTARHIGPSLPTDFQNTNGGDVEIEVPRLQNESAAIGPSLPPGLVMPLSDDDDQGGQEHYMELPSDDDEVIGPSLPSSSQETEELRYLQRLAKLEEDKDKEKNAMKREEWMVSLPKKGNVANVLGARTFSKRGVAEVSNEWMETPAQKRKRLENGDGPSTSSAETVERRAAQVRDTEQAAISASLNAHRGDSLLDQTRNRAAQQNGENGETSQGGRRAFDRERDMQVQGLQNLSSEEIKAKCGALNTRFGHSGNHKFL